MSYIGNIIISSAPSAEVERERENCETAVGYLIRNSRRAMHLPIRQLASMIHVNRSAIQHWEHGRRVPSAYHAFKLSIILGISLPLLCAQTKRETAHRAANPTAVPSNCPDLTKIFNI